MDIIPLVIKSDDDIEPVLIASEHLCPSCAHLDRDTWVTCKAFPAGIPLGILTHDFEHYVPYDVDGLSDGGVVFEPIEEVEKADVSHVPRDASGRWTKVGGNLGSNAGGVYLNDGIKHYVKFPSDPGQARAEAASDAVYEMLGVRTMKHRAMTIDGKLASVSKWQHVDILGPDGWKNLDDRQKQQAADAFMASALTKNWDVVGKVYDNMGKDKDGNLAILDTGGSFNFRAQGEHKSFGTDAEVEIGNMLNPEKTSGRVFGPLLEASPEVFKKAAEKVGALSDDALRKLIKGSGIHNADKNSEAIVKRKKAIVDYFTS